MRKSPRMVLALALLGAGTGIAVLSTPPASACTGDPCDGFCITYASLPTAVQQKVFHSTSCPVR